MSLFITFEGIDGSGKTTQVDILGHRLVGAGLEVVPIWEPGTTPMGSYIRRWLKGEHGKEEWLPASAELFLFAAARADLVAKIIGPAIDRQGPIVIADRYADSSLAYQGYGRGLPLEVVKAVNTLATDGRVPDITLLLDCVPEQGLRRIGAFQLRLPMDPAEEPGVGRREHEGDRFEEESLEFHDRVHEGYRELAEQEPERWRVIDATRSVEEVAADIWSHVRQLPGIDAPEGPSSHLDHDASDPSPRRRAGVGPPDGDAVHIPGGRGAA